ncbi:hypothetical protein Brms1b_012655 [Colletotrichum noveboracense]|nr:hypothetical protein COL940_014326 [Colletotrichum noveboracense]KAJ0268973.1 hypothetical protein CBS470a_013794 [Colletotrichum nupharicola]KAJ0300840.1 hypothetical protein Brms1b_012655 [Colletotrichum noveboracense]
MSDNPEARKAALLRRRRSDLTAQEIEELYDLKHPRKPRVGRDADPAVWYWGKMSPERLEEALESRRRAMEASKRTLERDKENEAAGRKREQEKRAASAGKDSNRESSQPLPITDDNIEADFFDLFEPGNSLTISTHYPGNPYGTSFYEYPSDKEDEDLFWDESDTRSRTEAVFDRKSQPSKGVPGNTHEKAVLLIEEILSGSPVDGPVVLLCKVKSGKDLPNLVVAKIFDPLFHPWDYPAGAGPWKEAARADMELCREAGAYDMLRSKGCHGESHVAPKYYGAYTTKVSSTQPALRHRTRRIGLILMEAIDHAKTSKELCDENEDESLVPITWKTIKFGKRSVRLNETLHLSVLEKLLGGVAAQMKAGVEVQAIRPEHILISFAEGTPGSQPVLRVSLVDYCESVVDSKRKEPRDFYQHYSLPPHPKTRFSPEKLFRLAGWFPYQWLETRSEWDEWIESAFNSDNFLERPDIE